MQRSSRPCSTKGNHFISVLPATENPGCSGNYPAAHRCTWTDGRSTHLRSSSSLHDRSPGTCRLPAEIPASRIHTECSTSLRNLPTLIDVSVLVHLHEDVLYSLDMTRLRGPNEIVVADFHLIPESQNGFHHTVYVFFRCDLELLPHIFSIFCPCSSVPVRRRTSYPLSLLNRAMASAIYGAVSD